MKRNKIVDLIQDKADIIICFICFFAAFYMQLSYLSPMDNVIVGHDTYYHYLRVEALSQMIRDGEIFRGGIDYLFMNGAGYASTASYPDLLLVIPALLRIAGVGIGTSMSVLLIICSIFTYLSMYICAGKITGNRICGTIAAVIYLLAPYRIDNIYTRFALGEILAFIFWPIIIYGLYDLVFGEFKKPQIIGFGFAGMIVTHTLSTFLAAVVCTVTVLVFIPRFIKKPKKILKLIATACVTALVTAYYWLPFLEMMSSADFTVSHGSFKADKNTVEFFKIFSNDNITGMGVLILAACLVRLLLIKSSPIYSKICEECNGKRPQPLIAADAFTVTGVVFILLVVKCKPVEFILKFVSFVQFPWRFYAVTFVLLSVSAAVYLYYVLRFTEGLKAGVIVVTLVSLFAMGLHKFGVDTRHEFYENDKYTANVEMTYHIGMGEWLPWNAKINLDKVKERTDKLLLDGEKEVEFERKGGKLTFVLPKEEYKYAEIPYIWYKGYTAKDETGLNMYVNMSDIGMVKVDLSRAVGEVTIEYRSTPLQVTAYIMTFTSLTGLIIFFFASKIKGKKKAAGK